MNILKGLASLLLFAAAVYGIARFAKCQMGYWFWQSEPETPPTTPGTRGPTDPTQ